MSKEVENRWYQHYMDLFEQESDRACVILTVSIIDELLTSALKIKLVPNHSSRDTLFDGANAPFSTFSAKIDLSHRIGLLSTQLCRDIHLIRKIRNEFAHNIEGCNFDDSRVKNRVIELSKSFQYLIEIYKTDKLSKNYSDGERGSFQFCASWIVDCISRLVDTSTSITMADNEWAYDLEQVKDRHKAL